MNNRVILCIEHLNKSFGSQRAVQDLSLEVMEGEIFGFLGPNGAGKTTTISMICGMLPSDSGQIRLSGGRTPRQARIGVCPQSLVIWEKLTCMEQLEFIGDMYDVPRSEARKRGGLLLEALGLADKRYRLAGTLSGGMQKRLNLALALVHNPELLVLDEPEAGLDPQSRVLVRDYIRAWAHEVPSRTVFFTTHNMDEADRMADRVAIIDQGRLLVVDTPESLKKRFGHEDVLEVHLHFNGMQPTEREVCVRTSLQNWMNQLRLVDDVIEIHKPGAAEDIPAVLDALRKSGLAVGEIRLRASTLENVFIHLTGKKLRE